MKEHFKLHLKRLENIRKHPELFVLPLQKILFPHLFPGWYTVLPVTEEANHLFSSPILFQRYGYTVKYKFSIGTFLKPLNTFVHAQFPAKHLI